MASNLASIGLWLDEEPSDEIAAPARRSSGDGGTSLGGRIKNMLTEPGGMLRLGAERGSGAKWNVLSRAGDIVAGVPGGVFQLGSDLARLPYHVVRQAVDPKAVGTGEGNFDIGKTFPAVFGIGKGFQETGNRIYSLAPGGTNPSDAWRGYAEDPLGTLLNDASNISVVAAPAAKAAGVAARTAEAGSLSARAANATQKFATGTARIGDIPVAPYRMAITRTGEALGKAGYNAELAAAGAPGVQVGTLGKALNRVGLSQPLARLSPEGKLLSNQLLEGRAQEANYAHDVLEADLPQLREQLSTIPKSDRAARQATIDSYMETHQEAIAPRIDEIRSQTAAQVAQAPFAHRLEAAVSPQGKLFGEADRATLEPVPEGFVRMSELRGGDMSTLFKGADDIALPKPLAEQVTSFFGAPMKGSEALRGVMGPVNKLNYTLKLGANPAWAAGNLFGNAFTVFANEGRKGLRQYVSDIRTGDFADDYARLQRAAPVRATIDQMQMTAVPEGEGNFAQRATTAVAQKAQKYSFFRLAERFDNAARSAVFKTELAKGASPEVALEKTLRATGEFDKLSPFERDYIKQIAPFWTWHREILKMSKNMLEDHPIRSGAMLNLSRNLGSEQGEPGETEIEAGQLVPYGQAGEWFGGGYGGFGKKLGPLPRAALAVGTGQNPSTGKDLRVGQEFGEQNTPGLHNTGAAISQFVKSYPQARLTQAVRGEDDFHTPAEGIASFLGVDASHQPKRQKKGKGANPNSVSYWLK